MLDAFKKHGSRPSPEQAGELDTLIVTSKEERAALSTMLTQLHLQAAKLAGAGQALQHVDERVAKAAGWLDRIAERMMTLESRAAAMEQERTDVEAARQELAKARADMRTTREMTGSFARELEHLPAIATTLSQDLVRLDGLVRSAHEDIAVAAKRVEDLGDDGCGASRGDGPDGTRGGAAPEAVASAPARTASDGMPALPARARANANAVARVSQLMDEARAAIRSLSLDPEVADRLDDQVGRMQTQLDTGSGPGSQR